MKNLTYKMVADDKELEGAFEVRRQVFVYEQGVLEELEYDGLDGIALHMVVKKGVRVIGTARVRLLSRNRAKIERMAILKTFRRKGIGSNIILFLKQELRNRHVKQIVLHAQCAVTEFYKSCGFKAIGAPFWEADIEHIKMLQQLV